MTSFGRSTRQGAIWSRINAIRETVGAGLRAPDDEGYTDDDGELDTEFDELVAEYEDIHTANETKG